MASLRTLVSNLRKSLDESTPEEIRKARKLLAAHYQADQEERRDYGNNYLAKAVPGQWKSAAAQYAKDKGRKRNDLFGDKARAAVHRPLIYQHVRELVKSPRTRYHVWMLAQHADDDVKLQRKVLRYLPKESAHYKYLYDRIRTNTGKPQKFGTQNVNKTLASFQRKR